MSDIEFTDTMNKYFNGKLITERARQIEVMLSKNDRLRADYEDAMLIKRLISSLMEHVQASIERIVNEHRLINEKRSDVNIKSTSEHNIDRYIVDKLNAERSLYKHMLDKVCVYIKLIENDDEYVQNNSLTGFLC